MERVLGGNSHLCPEGWCFLASVIPEVGDICVACKTFTLGTKVAADSPFRCPKLCSPSNDERRCLMPDLLRESIMPSQDFGDAGSFPCRVGSETQRKQLPQPVVAGDGFGKSKKGKVNKARLTPKSRQKLSRARERAAAPPPPINPPPRLPFQSGPFPPGVRAGGAGLAELPPLPPPLLPDHPTLAPTMAPRPPVLEELAASISLTHAEQIMLFVILILSLVLCGLVGVRLSKLCGCGGVGARYCQQGRCVSEETRLRRNEERLGRISDVARSISDSLDSTLERTNALSAKYESRTWEEWGVHGGMGDGPSAAKSEV